MNRTQLNAAEKAQVVTIYNDKGQAVDPHTKQPLQPGKIDLGHRTGLEERALQRCAERAGMTQKQYNQMVKANIPRLFYWEDRTQNRKHEHECKDVKVQDRNCNKLIREFLKQEAAQNKQRSNQKQLSVKSSPKARAMRGNKQPGNGKISVSNKMQGASKLNSAAGRSNGRSSNPSGGKSPAATGGLGAKSGAGSTGGKGGSSSGGGKGGTAGGAKGGGSAGGARGK